MLEMKMLTANCMPFVYAVALHSDIFLSFLDGPTKIMKCIFLAKCRRINRVFWKISASQRGANRWECGENYDMKPTCDAQCRRRDCTFGQNRIEIYFVGHFWLWHALTRLLYAQHSARSLSLSCRQSNPENDDIAKIDGRNSELQLWIVVYRQLSFSIEMHLSSSYICKWANVAVTGYQSINLYKSQELNSIFHFYFRTNLIKCDLKENN